MNTLFEQLNGLTFSKDLLFDELINKKLECFVKIGQEEKIEYILYYQNVFLLKTSNFNEALEEYSKI